MYSKYLITVICVHLVNGNVLPTIENMNPDLVIASSNVPNQPIRIINNPLTMTKKTMKEGEGEGEGEGEEGHKEQKIGSKLYNPGLIVAAANDPNRPLDVVLNPTTMIMKKKSMKKNGEDGEDGEDGEEGGEESKKATLHSNPEVERFEEFPYTLEALDENPSVEKLNSNPEAPAFSAEPWRWGRGWGWGWRGGWGRPWGWRGGWGRPWGWRGGWGWGHRWGW